MRSLKATSMPAALARERVDPGDFLAEAAELPTGQRAPSWARLGGLAVWHVPGWAPTGTASQLDQMGPAAAARRELEPG